ncbi:hypothetical protein B0A55_06975 [Friedmanniomyces simplex]|uniref:F-box domain-containing protein n=1 Tax=Friedmanniomyces simplex TaxID=329884 RepID=A0A4U0X475_9PEZI|nr:hypothetical protein B0A55_06975 [Friedmanniomyces simplex]
MLRKLRRASQQWSNKRRDSLIGTRSTQQNASSTNASFLGLPPEIRNQIYELSAAATSLTLPPMRSRKGPRPVGLLLACKQTHREYRALLLSQANIVVLISAFDFSNIIRVLQALPAKDAEALQTNTRLCMSLFLSHVPSREERRALLAWFVYRGDPNSDKAILFRYDVQFNIRLRPPRPPSRYLNGYHMKYDLLLTLIRRYVGLRHAVQEIASSTDELDRMLTDLQCCAGVLEDAMSGSE